MANLIMSWAEIVTQVSSYGTFDENRFSKAFSLTEKKLSPCTRHNAIALANPEKIKWHRDWPYLSEW